MDVSGVADPAYNLGETLRLAAEGDKARTAVMVFPELGLSSYAIEDLLLQDADIKGVLSDWASGYSNHHIALRHGVRRESIDQWIASLPKARLKEAQSQAATCTSIDFIRYAEQYRQVCRRLHEELGLPLRALSQRYSLTLVTLIRWSREESWETTPLEQVGVKLGFIIKTT